MNAYFDCAVAVCARTLALALAPWLAARRSLHDRDDRLQHANEKASLGPVESVVATERLAEQVATSLRVRAGK